MQIYFNPFGNLAYFYLGTWLIFTWELGRNLLTIHLYTPSKKKTQYIVSLQRGTNTFINRIRYEFVSNRLTLPIPYHLYNLSNTLCKHHLIHRRRLFLLRNVRKMNKQCLYREMLLVHNIKCLIINAVAHVCTCRIGNLRSNTLLPTDIQQMTHWQICHICGISICVNQFVFGDMSIIIRFCRVHKV